MLEENEAVDVPENDSDAQALKDEFSAIYDEVDGVEPSSEGEREPVTLDVETGEVLLGIVSPTFDMLCPNWGVTMEEKKALADAYGGVIDKYFPNLGNSAGPELVAVAMTAAIFAPRFGKARKLEEKNPVKNKFPEVPREQREQRESGPAVGLSLDDMPREVGVIDSAD